jgi:hypothetical protein
MKISILILILTVRCIFAQEIDVPFYILTPPINSEIVFLYDSGKIVTNSNKYGVTYSHQKCQLDFNTFTNGNLKMCFADGFVISLDENTQLKIHTAEAVKVNNTNIASVVRYSNQNYIFSLMSGVVDIFSESVTSKITIQTPRVSFILTSGKYRIIVDDKTTIIAVIDGKSTLSKVVETEEREIISGNFAHITTYYSLFSKGMPTPNSNRATSIIKPISTVDLDKMNVKFSDLKKLSADVIFVDVCESVHGIKIH